MRESRFAKTFAHKISSYLPDGVAIATKKSLLYTISFDETGKLQLGVNEAGEPIRGGGMGFEQDILIFERRSGNETSIVPRVCLEIKFDSVTTHDVIVYSEKARRIRSIYPFVRYGLTLGNIYSIPGRVLRLGQEFDFISTASVDPQQPEVERFAKVVKREIEASKKLGNLLARKVKATALYRNIFTRYIDSV